MPEVTAAFTHTMLDLRDKPALATGSIRWVREGDALVGEATGGGSQCAFAVDPDYLLQAELELDPGACFVLAMREQDKAGSGYRLTVNPSKQEAELASLGFRHQRRCFLAADKPITIQAIVHGTTIECFLNDACAVSCRAYDWPTGKLGLSVIGGKARVRSLSVKGLPSAGTAPR